MSLGEAEGLDGFLDRGDGQRCDGCGGFGVYEHGMVCVTSLVNLWVHRRSRRRFGFIDVRVGDVITQTSRTDLLKRS